MQRAKPVMRLPVVAALTAAIIGLAAVAAGAAAGQQSLSERLRERITAEELFAHAEAIVEHERPSGSVGENAAIDYVLRRLRAEGIPVQLHSFDAYTSLPVSATLTAVETGQQPRSITMAYSGNVENLEGSLVDLGLTADLPAIDRTSLEALAVVDDARANDASGAIALVRGLPFADAAWQLERMGFAGAVFVNPADRLNELTVTTIWGTPSLRNAHRVPTLPLTQVSAPDGEELARLAAEGGRVRMTVQVDTRWRPLRLVVARIEPRSGSAPYVLLGGHIDAWHHGGTDEGASNAAMIELTRAVWAERRGLRRGLVVAFWPGHSNGPYAGSTWFADEFRNELVERAVAYLNVDGIGQIGASQFSVSATAALEPLGQRTVARTAGADVRVFRPGRNSDQAFNGIGMPLLQFNHTPSAEDGGTWWWHTPEDTLDKIDAEVLELDAEIYAAALGELLTAPVPPLDAAAEIAELRELVLEAQATAGDAFDLTATVAALDALTREAAELQRRLSRLSAGPDAADRAVLAVLRPLYRVMFTASGPFHPDPFVDFQRLPGLAAVRTLDASGAGTDTYGFALTQLRRERNRLDAAIGEARAAAQHALEQ